MKKIWLIVFSIIISFVELIITYLMLYILNGNSISFIHFIYLLFSILPVVLIFISIGMVLSICDKYNIGLFIVSIFCISLIQFSQVLIHLKKDFVYVPIFNMLKNTGDFSNSSDIRIIPLCIMYLIAISFLIIAFRISTTLIKKKYER